VPPNRQVRGYSLIVAQRAA